MTDLELLAILLAASRVITAATEITERLNREGRNTLTAEEVATIKDAQKDAEDRWAAQLKKLREVED